MSKYRGLKYKRFSRELRKPPQFSIQEGCKFITNYFKPTESASTTNSIDLQQFIDLNNVEQENCVESLEPKKKGEVLSWLLKSLMESLKNNSSKKTGNRYDPELMMCCIYIYIVAGRLTYEFLSKNLPIACLKTVQNNLRRDYFSYIEGKYYQYNVLLGLFHVCLIHFLYSGFLNFDGLLKYLTENDLPMKVAIGEDATRVIKVVEYDAEKNCLVGLVAPYDKNGLPKIMHFKAASAQQIVENFKLAAKANYVIAIVAQPTMLGNIFLKTILTKQKILGKVFY